MSKHTTFKIGGPADIFLKVETIDELKYVINTCKDNKQTQADESKSFSRFHRISLLLLHENAPISFLYLYRRKTIRNVPTE